MAEIDPSKIVAMLARQMEILEQMRQHMDLLNARLDALQLLVQAIAEEKSDP